MCGVVGIYAYHSDAPPVDQEELLRIRDYMVSRGPDGKGEWYSSDNRVGLGHRRLSIIDLSNNAAQPMESKDGQLVISFNGEIYNYQELRKKLIAKGYHFRSYSDTEVLLHLYAEKGEDMVYDLRGMFAFVIWDARKQGMNKPLYMSDDGTTIKVASQVKALLKGGCINTSPDPAGHVGFFLWGHVPEPYTLYKGIRALPAGSTLWVDAKSRKQTRQFFNIAEELANNCESSLSLSRDEIQDQLRKKLLDSVRHHLIADVPVGVFLSAGLDSTTLAALAKEVGVDELRTITLGFKEFEGTECDEVPLAELVAQHYGAVHQTRWVTKEDFKSKFLDLLDAMDQPSTDGVNSYFVSKAAKDTGLKVVLSGLGGDELFGGYPSFQQIPRMVNVLAPLQSISSLGKGFRYISAQILKHFTSPKYAGLFEYGGTYGGAYLLRRGMFMPWELPDLLDGETVREGWNELQTLSRLEQTIQGVDNAHQKVTALETAWYMRNQLLRDADWASMAHSLEVRVPLVDTELFRAVTPLSNSVSAQSKLAMAETPTVPLPNQIMMRRKTGFSIPVREWILAGQHSRQDRGLRGWAHNIYHSFAGSKA